MSGLHLVGDFSGDLDALADGEFVARWPDLSDEERGNLAADVRRRAIERYRRLTPYVETSVDRAEREGAAQARRPAVPSFPWSWAGEAAPQLDAPQLIKGVIPAGAFALVFGPPGSGKSFLAADLAAHVAAGLDWRGHRVRGGPATYVAAEAGGAILGRFIAAREHVLPESFEGTWPLAVMTRGPDLLNMVQVEALIEELAAIAGAAGAPLGLVVVDTLSRSIQGADENSSEAMSLVVGAVDRLREATGAAVMLVHHSGKDSTRGARGHSSLLAACDVAISVDEKVATVVKSRDGRTGDVYAFDLRQVELGRDADGDAVTTCIVEHVEGDGAPMVLNTANLRGTPKVMLERLFAILRRYRRNLVDQGRPPDEARVNIGALREDLEKRGVPKATFYDALGALERRGLVRKDGDVLVPVEAPR